MTPETAIVDAYASRYLMVKRKCEQLDRRIADAMLEISRSGSGGPPELGLYIVAWRAEAEAAVSDFYDSLRQRHPEADMAEVKELFRKIS